jgi:hypothetical protein
MRLAARRSATADTTSPLARMLIFPAMHATELIR